MTRRKKILLKFFRNPQSLKYKEIETLLINKGFHKIQAKGSHLKFAHPKIKQKIILPVHANDCKDKYKEEVAKFLKKYSLLISWSHFITLLHTIIRDINIR